MPTARSGPSNIPIRSVRAQVILLGMWGVMLALAYPRPNLHVLAHFALVPLIILAVRAESKRLLWLTYAAGVLWWFVMTLWLSPVTRLGQIGLAFYMGLYPLAFLIGLRLVHRRVGPPLVLSVPILWVSLEYIRGLLMTGFPWFMLGHSQPTFMIQIADLIGAYGVSFLVAMSNGLVTDLLTQPLVRFTPGTNRRRRGVPVALSLPLYLAAMSLTVGYGVVRLGHTDTELANAPTLAVAVVQTNVPQSNKDQGTLEQDAERFARMVNFTRQAAAAGAKLVVWPETMIPRAINDESVAVFARVEHDLGRYRRETTALAADLSIHLVAGAHAMTDWQTEPSTGYLIARDRYNSAYLIEPDGSLAERYDKVHRVPFGEYMPFVETLPFLRSALLKLTPYDYDYSLRPGDSFTILTIAPDGEDRGWRLAAPICFEDVISHVPRRMMWDGNTKRADLLVNLSNDGWFAGTAEGPQHEQIARFRCVENRVAMARAVNTGVSSFIDSAGRIVHRFESPDGRTQSVDGFALHHVRLDGRATLFGRIGDAFALVTLLVGSMLTIWSAGRHRIGRHT